MSGTERLRLVACALLVVVLGAAGSASAAALIGSRQVKDGSLTGRDLRLGTVRGSDVRDRSLKARDFAVVPQGPTGPQGATGARGTSGSPGVSIVTVTPTVIQGSTQTFEVFCTSPQKAVFGGSVQSLRLETEQSAPAFDGSSWIFVIRSFSTIDKPVTLQAYCVTDR